MSTGRSITTAAGSLAFTSHKNIYLNLKSLKPELDSPLPQLSQYGFELYQHCLILSTGPVMSQGLL